jgi:hypothetical protein
MTEMSDHKSPETHTAATGLTSASIEEVERYVRAGIRDEAAAGDVGFAFIAEAVS